MIVKVCWSVQFKGFDLDIIRGFIDKSERTTYKVFALAVEKGREGAHESELKIAIAVKTICVRNSNPEISIYAQVFDFWNEFFTVTRYDLIKARNISWDHFDVITRLYFVFFQFPPLSLTTTS